MALAFEDHAAITELISMHGHLFDSGELDRLGELFTDDVVYDASDYGVGALEGIEAIRAAALELGERNPVAHHITNVVLTDLGDGRVHARSKGISVTTAGGAGSVTYEDTITRGEQGWRISRRELFARRIPLGGRCSVKPLDLQRTPGVTLGR
jgi:ketosteroid isomerase-like protein